VYVCVVCVRGVCARGVCCVCLCVHGVRVCGACVCARGVCVCARVCVCVCVCVCAWCVCVFVCVVCVYVCVCVCVCVCMYVKVGGARVWYFILPPDTNYKLTLFVPEQTGRSVILPELKDEKCRRGVICLHFSPKLTP
jgi:hypothetical protein